MWLLAALCSLPWGSCHEVTHNMVARTNPGGKETNGEGPRRSSQFIYPNLRGDIPWLLPSLALCGRGLNKVVNTSPPVSPGSSQRRATTFQVWLSSLSIGFTSLGYLIHFMRLLLPMIKSLQIILLIASLFSWVAERFTQLPGYLLCNLLGLEVESQTSFPWHAVLCTALIGFL